MHLWTYLWKAKALHQPKLNSCQTFQFYPFILISEMNRRERNSFRLQNNLSLDPTKPVEHT